MNHRLAGHKKSLILFMFTKNEHCDDVNV